MAEGKETPTRLRLYVHREGDDIWAFDPRRSLDRLRGTRKPDGSLAFGDVFTLRALADGTVELGASPPDGGRVMRVVLGEGSPWSSAQISADSGFSLRVGGSSARAQIRRDGRELSGYYRYGKATTDLLLTGTVDPKGGFTMTEKTEAGVVTGRWTGTFLSPAAAAGIWTSADGKRSLPITMIASPDLAPAVVASGLVGTIENVEHETVDAHECRNTNRLPRVSGLVPSTRNRLVNEFIATLFNAAEDVHCDGSEPSGPYWNEVNVSVDAQVPGYMSLDISQSVNLGGAHPMYGAHCVLLDTQTGTPADLTSILGARAFAKLMEVVKDDVRAYWHDNEVDPSYGNIDKLPVDGGVLCYVSRDKVEVRFGPYAIAPYMFGGATFAIDPAPLLPLLPLIPPSPAKSALFGGS